MISSEVRLPGQRIGSWPMVHAGHAEPLSGTLSGLLAEVLITLTLLSSMVWVTAATALPHVPSDTTLEIDRHVIGVLDSLTQGDLRRAQRASESLVRRFPSYRLGHLLHADILQAQASGLMMQDSSEIWQASLISLQLEARARYTRNQLAMPQPDKAPHTGSTPVAANDLLPSSILQVGRDIKHVVIVDLMHSKLDLYSNHSPEGLSRVYSHYISSGLGGPGKRIEGDLKTPVGIYRINGYWPDESLPELYGAGALTLDYPNAIDRREQRKGSGIWLHGTPTGTITRAPFSSEGCVVMPNDMLRLLQRQITPQQTLVVLLTRTDLQRRETAVQQMPTYLALFERYKKEMEPSTENSPASRAYRPSAPQLALVDRADLTVINYPAQPDASNNRTAALADASGNLETATNLPPIKRIMMQIPIQPDPHNSSSVIRVTLFWELDQTGTWQLAEESIQPVSP